MCLKWKSIIVQKKEKKLNEEICREMQTYTLKKGSMAEFILNSSVTT